MQTDPFRALIAKDLDAAGIAAEKTRPFEDMLAKRLDRVADLGTIHIELERILDLLLATDKDYRVEVTNHLQDLSIQHLHNLPSVASVLNKALLNYELAAYVVHDLYGVIGECWGELQQNP